MKKKTPAGRAAPQRKRVSRAHTSPKTATHPKVKRSPPARSHDLRQADAWPELALPPDPFVLSGFETPAEATAVHDAPSTTPGDVVTLILRDHQALKPLLQTMQNYGLDFAERQEAFEKFAPLLARHSKPEEQVLYGYLKSEDRLREDGLEGDVEHALADQLVAALEDTTELELYSARLKALAKLVEHHLEAEEEALLPHIRDHLELGEREAMGQRYLELRDGLAPDEARLSDAELQGPEALRARADLFGAEPAQALATDEDQDELPDEDLVAPGSDDVH